MPPTASVKRAPSRPDRRDVVIGAIVSLLAACGFCASGARWTGAAWSRPVGHLAGPPDVYTNPEYGDMFFTLATARAAGDGRFVPWAFKRVPELGAPHAAEWSDWPLIEEPQALLLGILYRALGPFAALNVALLVGHALAAATMFTVARAGGATRPWASVAGLAFGLAPFIFAQSPHHVTVAWAWHVPLFILAWRWAGDPQVVPGDRRSLLAAAIGAVAGVQNPYYTNVLCQLAILGGAVPALREGSWRRMRTAATIVAAAAVAFALMHLDTLAYAWVHGPNPAGVVREYKWMEIYGLKLVDLFVPTPAHRWEALARAGARHRDAAPLLDEGASYLGMVGIAAAVWLAVTAARGFLRRRTDEVPAAFWQTAWIVLVFTTGGLNAFAGAAGMLMFRTGCRMAIVILALVLEWAARRATEVAADGAPDGTPGAAGARSWAVAAALAGLVVWDEVPRAPSRETLAATDRRIDADRKFIALLEGALPAGAQVLQLPLMEFPESPVPGIGAYEQLRPYVLGSRLHWSFGTVKGRPREAWLGELAKKDAADAVAEVRSRGFDAIVIDRDGFPERGRALEAALLRASGADRLIVSPGGDETCIVLRAGP